MGRVAPCIGEHDTPPFTPRRCVMAADSSRDPWNKGKLVGQKAPFKLKEIRAILVRPQLGGAQ